MRETKLRTEGERNGEVAETVDEPVREYSEKNP